MVSETNEPLLLWEFTPAPDEDEDILLELRAAAMLPNGAWRSLPNFDGSRDGLCILDRNWRITSVNRVICRWWNIQDRTAVLGKTIWAAFPPYVQTRLPLELFRAQATRGIVVAALICPISGKAIEGHFFSYVSGAILQFRQSNSGGMAAEAGEEISGDEISGAGSSHIETTPKKAALLAAAEAEPGPRSPTLVSRYQHPVSLTGLPPPQRRLQLLDLLSLELSHATSVQEYARILESHLQRDGHIRGACLSVWDRETENLNRTQQFGLVPPDPPAPPGERSESYLLQQPLVRTIDRPMVQPGVRSLDLTLVSGDGLEGVLRLCVEEEGAGPEEEAPFFLALGQEAARCLCYARLFQEVRESREQTQRLSRRLVAIQEEEKRLLARELHDEIGQLLTGLQLNLQVGARQSHGERRAGARRSQELVAELITKVSDLSLSLRPSMLDDLGLAPALLWQIERYQQLTGIVVSFHQSGAEGRRFPREVETAAFRIAQEALTNVARHAGVREATVSLWADQVRLVVEVEDAGVGLDRVRPGYSSVGLAGMQERAEWVGGSLLIDSMPGRGCCISAEMPLTAAVPELSPISSPNGRTAG